MSWRLYHSSFFEDISTRDFSFGWVKQSKLNLDSRGYSLFGTSILGTTKKIVNHIYMGFPNDYFQNYLVKKLVSMK